MAALCSLDKQEDEIRAAMGKTVARNLQTMARMGVYLQEQVARRYPEFPLRLGFWDGKNICLRSAPCSTNCSRRIPEVLVS